MPGTAWTSDTAEDLRIKTNGNRRNFPSVQAANMYITTEAVALIALDGILEHCDGMMLVQTGLSQKDVVQFRILRPIVGFLSAALLLPQLRNASLKRSRLFGAAGLALLAASRIPIVSSAFSSFALCVSYLTCAVASALIQASTFYGLLMQGPVSFVGWRLNGAAFGLLLAPICGSWICVNLISVAGGLHKAAMLFGTGGTCMCCLHLAVSEAVLYDTSDVPRNSDGESNSPVCLGQLVDKSHEVPSARTMSLILSIGVSMVTASSSLSSFLLPAFLGEGLAGRSIVHLLPQLSLCSPAVLLLCGLFSKRFVFTACSTGVALAAATAALGLKAVVHGQQGSRSTEMLFGILAMQVGSGGYFGIALPQLARIALAEHRDSKSDSLADTSCLLVACLFFGHALEPLLHLLGFYNVRAGITLLILAVFQLILGTALVKFGLAAVCSDIPTKTSKSIPHSGH